MLLRCLSCWGQVMDNDLPSATHQSFAVGFPKEGRLFERRRIDGLNDHCLLMMAEAASKAHGHSRGDGNGKDESHLNFPCLIRISRAVVVKESLTAEFAPRQQRRPDTKSPARSPILTGRKTPLLLTSRSVSAQRLPAHLLRSR
jgi:hypothetical protein